MIKSDNVLNVSKKCGPQIFDWIILVLCALIGFIFFTHQDIIVTAERSFLLLDGHVAHFYSASANYTGDNGANYLPTTFILFAVWNIPIKILGLSPAAFLHSSTLQIFWYKLLPTLCYAFSGYLVFLIANRRFGFDKVKSKVLSLSFLSFSLAFFSQFIFAQYDIFTVLFMLFGMLYYFKDNMSQKDWILFCVFFGLASTCKYHALVIFIILLALKNKNIFKFIIYALIGFIPIFIEVLFYCITDYVSFKTQVLGFNALQYVNAFTINIGVGKIQISILLIFAIIAWAYFTECKNKNELLSYSMYFCSGICFCFFGLMTWHPQWLIFGTFFWTLGTFINKNYKVFMLLDIVEAFAFYVITVNTWHNWVDQNLFVRGVLKHFLLNKNLDNCMTMSTLYHIGANNLPLIFTAFVAILLVNFIFKHPKYCVDINDCEYSMALIRIRAIIGILAFMIPAFICLPSMLK